MRRTLLFVIAILAMTVPGQANAVVDTISGPVTWSLTCGTTSCSGSATLAFAGGAAVGVAHEETAILAVASANINRGCIRVGLEDFSLAYGTVSLTPLVAVRGTFIDFSATVLIPYYWDGLTGEVLLGSLRPTSVPSLHTRVQWSDSVITRDVLGGAGATIPLAGCGEPDFTMIGSMVA